MPGAADFLLRSSSCCGCIPVRAGFVLMSVLTFLLSGALSIIIWFEIFHSHDFSSKERVAFVLTGVVESILFLVSIAGFIGVVARKQLFVMIYTYFIYVHFVLNLIVGIYFLVTVRQSNRQALVTDCSDVFGNTSVESDCSSLMNISTYVFIAIVAALLALELYGVLIATRYVYRLRMQKRENRSRRLGYFHALATPEMLSKHSRQASDNIELLGSQTSAGDPQELESVVVDIGPESYLPVPTHDSDFPGVRTPSPQPSPPYSLSDTATSRRIRALPPRPAVPVITETSDPQQSVAQTVKPHEGSGPPQAQRQYSEGEDVSTNAHFALMDHAAYMESRFLSAPPVSNLS